MRILLAEDECDLNQIIRQKLTSDGYVVDCCFDGEEAMDYMACADYDAIIPDIMMPQKDGLEVLCAPCGSPGKGPSPVLDCERRHFGSGKGAGQRRKRLSSKALFL